MRERPGHPKRLECREIARRRDLTGPFRGDTDARVAEVYGPYVGRPAHRPPRRFSSAESCRVVEDADPYRINHVRGCTSRCTGGMNSSPTN